MLAELLARGNCQPRHAKAIRHGRRLARWCFRRWPSVEEVDQGSAPRSFCIGTALHIIIIKTECTLHLHVDKKHYLYYIHSLSPHVALLTEIDKYPENVPPYPCQMPILGIWVLVGDCLQKPRMHIGSTSVKFLTWYQDLLLGLFSH